MSNDNNNSKNQNIFNPGQAYLKADILYFKEELLEEVRKFDKKFTTQNQDIKENFEERFKLYDLSIDKLISQNQELTKLIASHNYLKEQIDKLTIFKKDITDLSSSNNLKLNTLEKETSNNVYRINSIINNSVLYPRLIGNNCKFKNFHEFIDYTLSQLSSVDNFRTRIEFDLKSFKAKMEKVIEALRLRIDNVISSTSQYITNGLQENEKKIKEFINEKMFEMEVKSNEIEIKIEKAMKELNKGINEIDNKANEMNTKVNEEISKIKEEAKLLNQNIVECKFHNNEIKNNINNLENLIEKKEQNKFDIENNKTEIIDIVKNIIEKEKKVLNINSEQKGNNNIVKTSTFDSRKQNLNFFKFKENKPSSSINRNNKIDIIDDKDKIKKNEKNETINNNKKDEDINPKLEYFFEKKNNLLNNTNNKSNLYIKDNNVYNDNNNNSYNSNNSNNSYKIETINKKDRDINQNYKENETKENEDNNKSILFFKENKKKNEGINNIEKSYMIKLNNDKEISTTNSNIINFKKGKKIIQDKRYLEKKIKEVKEPLKTLLKLKIDIKDINAQIRPQIKKENSYSKNKNEDITQNKVKKTIGKTLTYNTINIEPNRIKSMQYNDNKTEIKIRKNISNIQNKKLKDALKTKNNNLKTLNNFYDIKKKIFQDKIENDINLKQDIRTDFKLDNLGKMTLNASRNENTINELISTRKYNTFYKNNKNTNKLQLSKSFKISKFPVNINV